MEVEPLNLTHRSRSLRSTSGILAAALLLSGCGAPADADGQAPAIETSTATTPAAAASPGSVRQAAPSAASAGAMQDPSNATITDRPTEAPLRVSIPAIGVDAPLEVLSLDDGNSLQPPVDWDAAGWYDRSPVPGERGPSVIAGHLTAPDGPAVFVDLGALRPGDTVTVTHADRSTTTFAVDRTISAERTDSFPTEEIYGPTPDAQLRLITCDGEYDPARGHWTRNMVVFATALPQ